VAAVVVVEGTSLVITNLATDADVPTNTLTYSLGTNAPVGMTIDPASGVLTWTPGESQGPSTNPITVHVTDNGEPPLGATHLFTITVLETNQAPVLVAVVCQPWIWPAVAVGTALWVGGVLAAVGMLGDLAESAIKRAAGVKDSGRLIPGHGGVLDRLDSLFFAGPTLYALRWLGWV